MVLPLPLNLQVIASYGMHRPRASVDQEETASPTDETHPKAHPPALTIAFPDAVKKSFQKWIETKDNKPLWLYQCSQLQNSVITAAGSTRRGSANCANITVRVTREPRNFGPLGNCYSCAQPLSQPPRIKTHIIHQEPQQTDVVILRHVLRF